MPPSFDRLARHYHWLERLAFGGLLERARCAHLDRLRGCRVILLLGDGDGRVLARLCELCPEARITTVDLSAGMLARAAERLTEAQRSRVVFRCADALTAEFAAGAHDAVTTLFFLDCFTETQVRDLIVRLRPALRPGALWLFTDFAEPVTYWAGLRARVWLRVQYAFFRPVAGIPARQLPPSEKLLAEAGFRPVAETTLGAGLLRSAVFADGT